MRKPESLRQQLNKSIDYVRNNPDQLHIFIKDGAIISTTAPSLSFEYRYTLNVLITNYSGDANLIITPVLYWLRANQWDILNGRNPDGYQFEVDILDGDKSDIDINLKLTERVIVKERDGKMVIDYAPEPAPPYE